MALRRLLHIHKKETQYDNLKDAYKQNKVGQIFTGGDVAEAAFDGLSIAIPLQHFDGVVASVILLCMFSFAVLGVHPVISIAVVGHWIMPIAPDQTLLAIMFLMSWVLGVSTSPISGINLALHGHDGVSRGAIFRWNLPYGIKMYIA